MDVAFNLVLPIFGLIAVGYASARLGIVSAAGIDGMDRYVFSLAVPALLFRALANTELPTELPWGLWLSFYLATLAVWAVGGALARFVLGRSFAESVMIGFGGCQGNTVMLGIPIVLTGLGELAGPPLFFILAFHGLLLFTLATFFLESARPRADGERRGMGQILFSGLRGTARNPVMLGLFGGLVYGQLGVAIPGPMDGILELMGRSAIPCALFVTGGVLTRYRVGDNLGTASFSAGFKLIVHPLLVFCLARFVFALPPLWIAVATVLASMPTGVYSSILANRYQVVPGAASSAVVFSTALSLVTLTLVLNCFVP